jgi:hypothetical protein
VYKGEYNHMTDESKAIEYGKLYAEKMYEHFCDETMRGPNFTWERFPDLAARLGRVSLFTIFDRDKLRDELEPLEEICYNSCREEALKITREKGLS